MGSPVRIPTYDQCSPRPLVVATCFHQIPRALDSLGPHEDLLTFKVLKGGADLSDSVAWVPHTEAIGSRQTFTESRSKSMYLIYTNLGFARFKVSSKGHDANNKERERERYMISFHIIIYIYIHTYILYIYIYIYILHIYIVEYNIYIYIYNIYIYIIYIYVYIYICIYIYV